MKHTGFIEIDKPREDVVKYFINPTDRKEYQDGFVRSELVEGKLGDLNSV